MFLFFSICFLLHFLLICSKWSDENYPFQFQELSEKNSISFSFVFLSVWYICIHSLALLNWSTCLRQSLPTKKTTIIYFCCEWTCILRNKFLENPFLRCVHNKETYIFFLPSTYTCNSSTVFYFCYLKF